ncbi:histidine kinase-like ATPase [Lipomyces oligophaga]|uniref:histidine kinase-like ATPase n=1 Tax=Lipomyces oligophaga TaxID=45792 RepID=UPI0034CF2B19
MAIRDLSMQRSMKLAAELCRRSRRNYSKFSLDEPVFPGIDMEKVISEYSKGSASKYTLSDLTRLGRPPISSEELLGNALVLKHEILCSLAQRAIALRNLPYIVMLNPNISQIYLKYLASISFVYGSRHELASTPAAENQALVQAFEKMVAEHTDAIPVLAKGIDEAKNYISSRRATEFLDTHLRARLGIRLAAKHHIMLSQQSEQPDLNRASFIGMVDTQLRPAELCQTIASLLADVSDLQYGVRPTIEIERGKDITGIYVSEHLEYILTELLKNSFRATIEHSVGDTPAARATAAEDSKPADVSTKLHGSVPLIPVQITITRSGDLVQIRIRDRGGGIPSAQLEKIWKYSESTFEEDDRDQGFKTINTPPPSVTGTGGSSMGGLGYGLPLSKAYAEYFGGKIELESIFGWGTDAYVTIRCPEAI